MTFSVIVPFHDAAATLGACLDSLVAAARKLEEAGGRGTETRTEIICVDDGSGDGSAALVEGYASEASGFRLLRQANAGPGAARNAGLDAATGDLVVFADADDVLEEDALVRLAAVDADIVTFLPPEGRWDLARPEDRRRLFSPLVGNLLVWNAAYRRKTIGGWRFPALRNHEDLVWTTGMFARARTVVGGVKPWYVHRERVAGSLTDTYSWRRVRDALVATVLMFRAAGGAHAGPMTRLVLARKMALHLLLHALAVVPRVGRGCR